jgi:membrane-bound serine protease (ClpP class)
MHRRPPLRRLGVVFTLLGLAALLAAACASTPAPSGGILLLEARGGINSVMSAYIGRGIAAAESQGASALVLQLDTPGGLDSSMREIIQKMNSSTVPVIVYVSPTGARAASAGTFITEAAALAVMAPGTNIGAASPVASGGGDIGGTEGKKITNDAAAFIRSLADQHGRNADWAESAVRDAAALPASDAVDRHVVDFLAPDLPSLLAQADGRTVRLASGDTVLHTSGLPVVVRSKTAAEQVLDVISDPNIAFLLLSIGGLALAFEIIHPTVVTGVFGAIVFVTGLFALGSLPTNWAGAALIVMGFGLFVADIYLGGVGVLAAGGVTALIVGGILLVSGTGQGARVSPWLAIGVPLVIGALFVGGISALYRSRRRPSVVGETALIGRQATVRSALGPEGHVMLDGEIWKAHLTEGVAQPGETVTVTGVRGLELEVRGTPIPAAVTSPPPQTPIDPD